MRIDLITALLFTTTAVVHSTVLVSRSKLNGPCTGKDGVGGVCVPTASCSRDNGTYIDNGCPGTPEDIKCCTKTKCQREARIGDCRWTDQCTGGKSLMKNLCPGPDAFRCCVADEGEHGGHEGYNSTSVQPTGAPTSTSKAIVIPSSSAKPKPKPTPKPKPKPKPKPTKPKPNLGEKILAKAKEAKGLPYHWAGGNCKGPTGGGFDCSGLVSWAVCQVTGRDLFSEGLRVTRSMYCASEKKLKYKKVKWEHRRAGDAVFFGGECDCKNNPGGIHHVGLMMDDGYTMFNALKTGTKIRKDNFKHWGEKACDHVIRFT